MKNFETQRYTIAWLWRAAAWLVSLAGLSLISTTILPSSCGVTCLQIFAVEELGGFSLTIRLADIRAAGFKAVICGTMVPNIYMAYGFKILGTYDWAHGKTSLMLLTL